MRKTRGTLLLAAAFMTCGMLSGCGKKEGSTVASTELVTEATTEEASTLEVRDGMVLNPLTGEWIDESYANARPIAVMINNLKPALPQAGIEKADIMYEVLVEGGITRMMGIYMDYSDMEKIGPIRSARHYYVKLANEYDAIYVHVGHSTYAVTELADSGIDHIDGTEGIGNIFTYRTSDRKAPHNCYSSTEGILKAFEKTGFSLTHGDGYDANKLVFNSEDTELADGTVANKLTTAFNNSRKPWFEYNAEDKLYYRFEYSDKQIDEITGNQLKYKNVIIQFASHSVLDEKKDLQEIKLTGTGEGFYATDGKMIPITWEKQTEKSVTKYYTADGQQLKLNPGKTWITIFKDTDKGGIIAE